VELNVSWHDWKKILHMAVKTSDFIGMPDEQVNKIACWIGEFLAQKIDPGNSEQRLLNELWLEADDEDKRVLAKLIIRMVDKTTKM